MLDGFEGLDRQLQKLSDNARRLHGNHDVPLAELLNDSFVRRNTGFHSLNEMKESYGGLDSGDDLETDEWAAFVASHSRFDGWEAMAQAAATEWVTSQLEL